MNDQIEHVHSARRQVRYDRGRHWRAKLGFVVLAMEQTVEDDLFRLAPRGVGVHFSRLRMSNDATVDTLKAMDSGIAEAASLILPDDELDVVCYTCNCGTMVIGEEAVMRALAQGCPGSQKTTVMSGVVRALRALGARRIVVGTPYLDEVNDHVLRFLRERDFEIVDFHGLNIRKNTDIDLVAPEYLLEFGKSIDRPDADAIFLCCGALRTLDIVGELEQQTGKPAVVSNQAMMWDVLRLAGIDDSIDGYGRLFELDAAAAERAA